MNKLTDLKLSPGSIYFGDELVGDTYDIECTEEICSEPSKPIIRSSGSLEGELTATVNVPVFRELFDTNPSGFFMEYSGSRLEQVRRHKKKRINKKWAKRYGYRIVPCMYRVENARFIQGLNGDLDILFAPAKIKTEIM